MRIHILYTIGKDTDSAMTKNFVYGLREPHYFGKPDPDPHQSKTLGPVPDLH
jgi:hypothetical protein